MSFPVSAKRKNVIGILIGVALDLWIALGKCCHLNNIKPSNP
jgi:hypothetical protein